MKTETQRRKGAKAQRTVFPLRLCAFAPLRFDTHAQRPYRFVIIGGGISGLALAWFLRQRFNDASIIVLEKQERPGGWIRTVRCGDFLFEEGPRSCRSRGTGTATLQLIEDLKLESQWLAAAPASQKRFLYIDGSLQQMPNGILGFLSSPLTRCLIPAFCKEWRVSPLEKEDESIYDFISRRLNKDIAERFIDPMTSGIYAGDIRQLSMRSCFPAIYELEQAHGSLLKGFVKGLFRKKEEPHLSSFVKKAQKFPIFTLKNGMESLITALSNSIGNDLNLGTAAINFEVKNDEIQISTNQGSTFSADHVFITTPAEATKELLKSLKIDVPSLPHASLAVVNMGWNSDVLKKSGFGYLIPTKEKEKLLGMVWDSSAFPGQNTYPNQTRMTAMLGGMHHPDIPQLQDEELIALAMESLQKHLNISIPPDTIHTKTTRQAIPQYPVGHLTKVQALEQNLAKASNSRISLLGIPWHGVSVNDCIANAKTLVSTLCV